MAPLPDQKACGPPVPSSGPVLSLPPTPLADHAQPVETCSLPPMRSVAPLLHPPSETSSATLLCPALLSTASLTVRDRLRSLPPSVPKTTTAAAQTTAAVAHSAPRAL